MTNESKDAKRGPWCVYMLECANGAIYTGVSSDLNRRFTEHLKKTSHYTGYNPPKRILYREHYPTRALAARALGS